MTSNYRTFSMQISSIFSSLCLVLCLFLMFQRTSKTCSFFILEDLIPKIIYFFLCRHIFYFVNSFFHFSLKLFFRCFRHPITIEELRSFFKATYMYGFCLLFFHYLFYYSINLPTRIYSILTLDSSALCQFCNQLANYVF